MAKLYSGVFHITLGVEPPASNLPPVNDNAARGSLLAELFVDLATHYPAGSRRPENVAMDLGEVPRPGMNDWMPDSWISVELDTENAIREWLPEIDVWLHNMGAALRGHRRETATELISLASAEEYARWAEVAAWKGTTEPVSVGGSLEAMNSYRANVEEIAQSVRARLASVDRARKRLPSRRLVRIVGSLGLLAFVSGVIYPMYDQAASHLVDLYVPATLYALTVLFGAFRVFTYATSLEKAAPN